MAQKVATARKMKSRQETTSLGQIATVTAKPTISDKHLQAPTRDVLKIQMGDMGPLPWQGLNILFSEKVVIRQSSSQCPGLSVWAVIGLKVNPEGNYPPLLCGTVSYVVRGQHCSS